MRVDLWKRRAAAAGFAAIGATRLDRLFAGRGGRGAILMFHRVRPEAEARLDVNRGLSVTPDFLRVVVATLRESGFDLVTLDDALARLGAADARRFACLTFDDGYRDNLEFAVPILREFAVPFTMFVASGFATHSARAWWEDVEGALCALDRIKIAIGGERFDLQAQSMDEKNAAAAAIFKAIGKTRLKAAQKAIENLAEQSGARALCDPEKLFLGWDDVAALSRDPLCEIGAHTITHPRLAELDRAEAEREIAGGRNEIAQRIGRPVRHFAYPYGGAQAVGRREVELVRELGFASAVTTRPGLLSSGHAALTTALPRLSVNGFWQSRRALEILLSGLPFALYNFARAVKIG